MHSKLILVVAFAFIGYTLSAAVESPKSLDSVNAAPERRNDLLVAADEPQPEADTLTDDLDSSATHYRGYRRAYYGGYGGYGGYPSYGGYGGYGGYPSYGGYGGYGGYGYGHRRGGYYGGYGHGYGGYPGYYGGYRHGYY